MSKINQHWTEKEDALLREQYPQIGLKVTEMLPDRTYNAIRGRIQALGLLCNKRASWTPEEIDILRKWYPVNPNEAAKRLPNHTIGSCSVKATHLGITQKKYAPAPAKKSAWTAHEDKILSIYYSSEGRDVSFRLPGRTADACIIRASVLGITYEKNNSRFWTAQEEKLLKHYWKTEGENVSLRLKNRTPAACRQKAKKLGL